MLKIVLADHRHVRAISIIWEGLYEEMAILRPDYFTAGYVDVKLIIRAIEDAKQEIFVAMDHDSVVGFARIAMRETPSIGPYRSRKYAVITDIAVDPAFRGIDIGTMLITEVKKWTKTKALDYLEICVLSENEGAVRLYGRENFETVMQIMRCSI